MNETMEIDKAKQLQQENEINECLQKFVKQRMESTSESKKKEETLITPRYEQKKLERFNIERGQGCCKGSYLPCYRNNKPVLADDKQHLSELLGVINQSSFDSFRSLYY